MGTTWRKLAERATIQAAFVAIASRIVGSAFRCLETLNPQYQQSNVANDPKTVCIRELSTIGMAWCFALLTNAIITPKALARNWSNFKIQFVTSIVGTAVAEAMGRLIAYRKLYRAKSKALPPLQGEPTRSAVWQSEAPNAGLLRVGSQVKPDASFCNSSQALGRTGVLRPVLTSGQVNVYPGSWMT